MAKGSETGGCLNCYAAAQASRFAGAGDTMPDGKSPGPFHGFARRTENGPRWTGKVELVEKHLNDPLHWKAPKRIFVNSMSDLFHEALDDEAISAVFAVMSQSPQHTFQILTKRPQRMLDWFSRWMVTDGVEESGITRFDWCHANTDGRWPLPNVWLGVSAEDQKTWDERTAILEQVPAAVRWVSLEPQLASVDVGPALKRGKIHWLVQGGESGPGARPFDIEWARKAMAQCKATRVAYFLKQVGAFPCEDREVGSAKGGCHVPLRFRDRKGGDVSEWPEWARVREFPKTRVE